MCIRDRYTLTLAAGDTHGDVTIWNVTEGEVKSKFGERSVRVDLYFALESMNAEKASRQVTNGFQGPLTF